MSCASSVGELTLQSCPPRRTTAVVLEDHSCASALLPLRRFHRRHIEFAREPNLIGEVIAGSRKGPDVAAGEITANVFTDQICYHPLLVKKASDDAIPAERAEAVQIGMRRRGPRNTRRGMESTALPSVKGQP